ncbi:hypothetical protein Hdeb2414_s0008g00290331 [Helianthus debilis subsp. tardiflorus]
MARDARRGKHYQACVGSTRKLHGSPTLVLAKSLKLKVQISSKSKSEHELVISTERGVTRWELEKERVKRIMDAKNVCADARVKRLMEFTWL